MLSLFSQVKEKSFRYQVAVAVIMIATVIIGSGLTLVQASAHEANQGQALLAQGSVDTYGLDTAAPPDLKKAGSLGGQVGNIISGLLGFIGIALLLLLIYGGFVYMTAGGNEEKVNTAKKIMASAVVGFILIFLSYTITVFIARNFFSVPQPAGNVPGGPGTPIYGACVDEGISCEVKNQVDCSGTFAGEGTNCQQVCIPPIGDCDPSLRTCYACGSG